MNEFARNTSSYHCCHTVLKEFFCCTFRSTELFQQIYGLREDMTVFFILVEIWGGSDVWRISQLWVREHVCRLIMIIWMVWFDHNYKCHGTDEKMHAMKLILSVFRRQMTNSDVFKLQNKTVTNLRFVVPVCMCLYVQRRNIHKPTHLIQHLSWASLFVVVMFTIATHCIYRHFILFSKKESSA